MNAHQVNSNTYKGEIMKALSTPYADGCTASRQCLSRVCQSQFISLVLSLIKASRASPVPPKAPFLDLVRALLRAFCKSVRMASSHHAQTHRLCVSISRYVSSNIKLRYSSSPKQEPHRLVRQPSCRHPKLANQSQGNFPCQARKEADDSESFTYPRVPSKFLQRLRAVTGLP